LHCCDCHNSHVQSSEEEEVSRCCKKHLCDRLRSWFSNPNRHFPWSFSVMKSLSLSLCLSLTTISKDLKESCVFFRTLCFYNQISVEIVCNPLSSLFVTLGDNDCCSVTTDPESAEKKLSGRRKDSLPRQANIFQWLSFRHLLQGLPSLSHFDSIDINKHRKLFILYSCLQVRALMYTLY
jgi:hypothetical protein